MPARVYLLPYLVISLLTSSSTRLLEKLVELTLTDACLAGLYAVFNKAFILMNVLFCEHGASHRHASSLNRYLILN